MADHLPGLTTLIVLLMVNAYINPSELSIETLEQLNTEGRNVRILTNSLASHDVSVVDSHYRTWRKAMVVDRQWMYVGSMNFDSRSALLNTEMGVIIQSSRLGEALAARSGTFSQGNAQGILLSNSR